MSILKGSPESAQDRMKNHHASPLPVKEIEFCSEPEQLA